MLLGGTFKRLENCFGQAFSLIPIWFHHVVPQCCRRQGIAFLRKMKAIVAKVGKVSIPVWYRWKLNSLQKRLNIDDEIVTIVELFQL